MALYILKDKVSGLLRALPRSGAGQPHHPGASSLRLALGSVCPAPATPTLGIGKLRLAEVQWLAQGQTRGCKPPSLGTDRDRAISSLAVLQLGRPGRPGQAGSGAAGRGASRPRAAAFPGPVPAGRPAEASPSRGAQPTAAPRVPAGLPGARGQPRRRAPGRRRARPARLLRVSGRPRPLARAAHPLRPPLPALPGALPRHRPDAHVAAPRPGLARPLAQRLALTADCGRAPAPRARRGQPGGDQRLSRLGTPGGARPSPVPGGARPPPAADQRRAPPGRAGPAGGRAWAPRGRGGGPGGETVPLAPGPPAVFSVGGGCALLGPHRLLNFRPSPPPPGSYGN